MSKDTTFEATDKLEDISVHKVRGRDVYMAYEGETLIANIARKKDADHWRVDIIGRGVVDREFTSATAATEFVFGYSLAKSTLN